MTVSRGLEPLPADPPSGGSPLRRVAPAPLAQSSRGRRLFPPARLAAAAELLDLPGAGEPAAPGVVAVMRAEDERGLARVVARGECVEAREHWKRCLRHSKMTTAMVG